MYWYWPDVSNSFWMATPSTPLTVRKRRLTRMMMPQSRRRLCLNLLWEASCRSEPPKKLHVKKHSLAAETQD